MITRDNIKFNLYSSLPMLAALALMLSVYYNLIFFSSLKSGKVFFKFLTLSDHITSALYALILIIPITIVIFSITVRRIRYLERSGKKDGHPYWSLYGYLLSIMVIFFISEQFRNAITSDLFISIPLILMGVYYAFFPSLLLKLTWSKTFNFQESFVVAFTPILFIVTTNLAAPYRSKIIRSSLTKIVTENSIIEAEILRSIDKGILIKFDNQVHFVNWEVIENIESEIIIKKRSLKEMQLRPPVSLAK